MVVNSREFPNSRLIFKIFSDYLQKKCKFLLERKCGRGNCLFACYFDYTNFESFYEVFISLSINGRELRLKSSIVDGDRKLYEFSIPFKIGGRFKKNDLETFFERAFGIIETVREVIEDETLEEYFEMERFLRELNLSKNDIKGLFFEKLLPFKDTDFYKYRKLRRILEIRLKYGERKRVL